jgi:hypothetical protein
MIKYCLPPDNRRMDRWLTRAELMFYDELSAIEKEHVQVCLAELNDETQKTAGGSKAATAAAAGPLKAVIEAAEAAPVPTTLPLKLTLPGMRRAGSTGSTGAPPAQSPLTVLEDDNASGDMDLAVGDAVAAGDDVDMTERDLDDDADRSSQVARPRKQKALRRGVTWGADDEFGGGMKAVDDDEEEEEPAGAGDEEEDGDEEDDDDDEADEEDNDDDDDSEVGGRGGRKGKARVKAAKSAKAAKAAKLKTQRGGAGKGKGRRMRNKGDDEDEDEEDGDEEDEEDEEQGDDDEDEDDDEDDDDDDDEDRLDPHAHSSLKHKLSSSGSMVAHLPGAATMATSARTGTQSQLSVSSQSTSRANTRCVVAGGAEGVSRVACCRVIWSEVR